MKKRLLLILIPLSPILFSQTQLENPGFEGAWENVTGSEDEPEEWSSLKTADALGLVAPIVLFQSTDAHSGNYSARLKNTTTAGIVANGIVTNGQVHADFDPEEGYVFTNTDNSDWNTPFTDRPDSIVAWIKYAPSGGDKAKIEMLLHKTGATGKLPEIGATDHWVGRARYEITTSHTSWTRISAPFEYFSADNPTHALVVVTSGDSTVAIDGSEMWIDDIELIYNPPGTSISENKPNYNVSIHGNRILVNTSNYEGTVLSLYGMDGKKIDEFELTNTHNEFTVNYRGVLIYQMKQNELLTTGRIQLF